MKKIESPKGYGIVQTDVLRMKISQEAKLVYCYLASMTGKSEWCWPKIETIRGDLGMRKQAVIDSIRTLETEGLLKVSQLNNSPWVKNKKYRIFFLVEEGTAESSEAEPPVVQTPEPSESSHAEPPKNNNTSTTKDLNTSPTSDEVAKANKAPAFFKQQPAPSLPAEHKAELDFSWTTLKKYDLLPTSQTERRKTYFAMATHFYRAPVEVLKFANEIAGRWFERASKDQLFPLTANGKIRWAVSETEAAITLAGMWLTRREEFFAALKRIINDPKFWKVTFTSLTHFPKAYHSLKDAA